MSALTEGRVIGAVARVVEVAPNPVLTGLAEAAEHREAFSPAVMRPVDGAQMQMEEICALLRAVKDGALTEAQATQRLSRSLPCYVHSRERRGARGGNRRTRSPRSFPICFSELTYHSKGDILRPAFEWLHVEPSPSGQFPMLF